MARIRLDEAAALTVADVTHSDFKALPASATVGDVREWFAASDSRRLALLADDGRYAGSLVPEDVDETADPARPAVELARREPTVAPGDPALRGEELALSTGTRRVPVVDHDGRLLGIVAVTTDLQGYCGTGGSDGC
jgi:CBS domain-containing protein